MTESSARGSKPFWNGVCLLLSGSAIGWLVGLSSSPVAHLLIASVLAAAGGVVGALAGFEHEPPGTESASEEEEKPLLGEDQKPLKATASSFSHGRRSKVDPIWITLFLIGLIPGSVCGIEARSREWFGADPKDLSAKWSVTGLSDKQIARRLFDQLYPPSNDAEADPEELTKKWKITGLSDKQIAKRLFDRAYSGAADTETPPKKKKPDDKESKPEKQNGGRPNERCHCVSAWRLALINYSSL